MIVRQTDALTGLAAIEKINLAKVSLQRIKDYIQSQTYQKLELPGMPDRQIPGESKDKPRKRKIVRQKRLQIATAGEAPVIEAPGLFQG